MAANKQMYHCLSFPLRKPLKKRSIETIDEMESFRGNNDKIKDFACVNESMCPFGFSFMKWFFYIRFNR